MIKTVVATTVAALAFACLLAAPIPGAVDALAAEAAKPAAPAAGYAMAQATTTVDFGPVLEAVLGVVAVVLTAVGSWLARRAAKWLGAGLDEGQRQVIETAINQGVNFARSRLLDSMRGKTKVEVKNAIVGMAATYVLSKVPDAMIHFGLTKEDVEELIEARLQAFDDNPGLPPAVAPAAVPAAPPPSSNA